MGKQNRRRLFVQTLLLSALLLIAALLCRARAAAGTETLAPGTRAVLPVLMYHSILADPARAGMHVVSPDTLESDLAYLAARGYTAVVMADVIAFVRGEKALPEKSVLLSFDDGCYNNLTYALPLLEKYDMRAVLSVVGAYTDRYTASRDPNPNYACLAWDEVRALAESGRFEIQHHSYGMHALSPRRGSDIRRGESEAAYRSAFFADTKKLLAAFDREQIAVSTYTYPFGCIGPNTGDYLREMGFSASLSCFERVNVLTVGDPDCLFCLGRYNRPSGPSSEAFLKDILGAA